MSLSLMIESPNPVAMRVSLYSTHTRLQTTECEAFLPPQVGEGACTSGGHTTCHPLLMDERHYSSWGQVPPTIKGPSQWLRKHGSGKGRKKTVAAERININAARRIGQRRKVEFLFCQYYYSHVRNVHL